MSSNGVAQPLNIVVVGGSLGGLCAGIALKHLGHNVTILERNPTPLLQNQGAGIVAGGDTLRFFERYDRCKRPIAVSSQARLYLDKDGNVVHRKEMVQNMTSWDLAYYLLRANFDELESDYCSAPPKDPSHGQAIHRHGHTVTGVTETDAGEKAGIRVSFHRSDSNSDGIIIADFVIGADGPSSGVRKSLQPDVTRSMVGYVALRGTVPELEASEATQHIFRERFTFFHGKHTQILAYLIPGSNGSLTSGERLINFVWYSNFPLDSSEFADLMTDSEGNRHRITLPPGKMKPEVWERQKDIAKTTLPPQFAEVIARTRRPFVQAITDVISPKNEYMGGKLFLIGDALAGFRPHTVASTSQAAFDAMLLADMLEGKISREKFVLETMQYARYLQRRGVEMGQHSQFEDDSLESYIKDRDEASIPRDQVVYPEWTRDGLP